ncbi:MAG TPA: DnaJ domain-containing protein [Candidatus Limnocylindrales bacterium]|nr:DnaJ domain-containing protein [Candidatus Limnocylindrales bacterium]
MAAHIDPYRTLGLAPGASLDEIRRAYRRLAKAHHPDAAGETALPRFLAIQQAYEQLAGPNRGRRIGGRPGTPAGGAGPDPAREPWRADPDRARASGRADGGRAPGARPAGPRPADGRRPTGGAAASGTAGPTGAPEGPARDGSTTDGAGGRTRRSGGRRRAPNKATPGSTSYEGAEDEPFEPGWSGATWYGTSSGTYWTINPKEYADPRKHGPEYQARARRAATGGPVLEGATTSAAGDVPEAPAGPAPGARPTADAPPADVGTRPTRSGHVPPRSEAWSRRRAAAGAGPPDDPESAPEAQAADAGAPSWMPPQRDAGEIRIDADAPRSRRTAGSTPPPGEPPRGFRTWVDEAPRGRLRAPLLREPTTALGRLAMALLGWPPLGLFAASVIDQSTGCGRYAASCSEVWSPGTWILNAAILLLLLAVSRVAAWSAHGTIAAVVVGVPTAVALSAGGGSNVPEASAPVLLGTLAVAYLAGVAFAIVAGRPGTRGPRPAP